ncbi:MAG TPA: TonB C-terminal domain-containing protein [Gemmatimonadaceae bacterium]|nr:TonB C-terminal domain-containing protein [Gemmatimonadaceae bacterium]
MSGREARLTGPLLASAVLHGAALAALFVVRAGDPPMALPPIYRVNIVAAPAGPRAIGEVTPEPGRPAQAAPPRPAAEQPVQQMPSPDRAPVRAPRRVTPTAPAASQPRAPAARAGGGPIGGRGTDVATVQTEGIEFPYPVYLNNIVRQIALRFQPPNPDARLKAEVMFLIHRDGSVSNVRFITRSGSYPFDLEAQGAVEAAAVARAFGPLPEGFPDDVLPVVFSFDPAVLR